MKKLLVSLLVVFSFALNAQNFTYNNINYVVTDATTKTVMVGDHYKDMTLGAVVIPSTVVYNNDNYTVTRISEHAFGRSSMTSISLPNTITRIDSGAFRRCDNLINITIPNSVTYLGGGVLHNCANLQTVSLGNSVDTIGHWAFSYDPKLMAITFPPSVTYIGTDILHNCTGLTAITSQVVNPPTTVVSAFNAVPSSSVSVYVPQQSVNQYQAAPAWNAFTIMPMITTNVSSVKPTTDITITASNSSIIINNANGHKVTIINLNGQTIFNDVVNSSSEIINVNIQTGVYVVQLNDSINPVTVKKIMVQ